MSKFQNVAAVADNFVLDHFGDQFRWTKADFSTVDFSGILDFDMAEDGSAGEYSSRTKTITALSSVLGSFKVRETIQEIDALGSPTGPVYELQDEIENDGNFITIELIS